MIETVQKPTKQTPYATGDGSNNRESGKKTLFLVSICITLVVIFSLISLILLGSKS